MILLSLLLGNAMRMRGAVLQFGGSLVVLVMRPIIKTSGHIGKTPTAAYLYHLKQDP